MKHVLLWADDCESELVAELGSVLPHPEIKRTPAGLLEATFSFSPENPLPQLAFSRQLLPDAAPARAESINGWTAIVMEAIKARLPEGLPWALHIEPHYGETVVHRMGARAWHSLKRSSASPANLVRKGDVVQATAGRRRCDLIRSSVMESLRKTRRHLFKTLRAVPETFTREDSLVQLLLTSPEEGYLSIATRPVPWEQRHMISPFPCGAVPQPADPAAPSRAFAKLVEAEHRLGRAISAGQTCVDLGAAPGSWTYVAVSRGARVVAVDRSPLRQDLMGSGRVSFVEHDAFTFQPSQPVDWLLCDVIAEPGRSAGLLLEWLRHGWCRGFVVTLKLKGGPGLNTLAKLKSELPALADEWRMLKLCANKKEVCVFGLIGTSSKPQSLRKGSLRTEVSE